MSFVSAGDSGAFFVFFILGLLYSPHLWSSTERAFFWKNLSVISTGYSHQEPVAQPTVSFESPSHFEGYVTVYVTLTRQNSTKIANLRI